MIQLRARPIGPEAEPDAVDLLLECHQRIRRFLELAARLAVPDGASEGLIPEAASQVFRYFTVALPLHSRDEDELVFPRLMLAHPPAAVPRELQAMSGEHEDLNRLIDQLAPGWLALAGGLSRPAGMAKLVKRLHALLIPHLAREETLIFPVMRKLLSAESQREIVTEMRRRRTR